MKYIQADKLIAEIERRKKALHATIFNDEYNDLLAFITSLQQEQPEVDLELELKKEATKFAQSKEFWSEENPLLSTARHFAKWGAIHLNTRKEE